MFSTLTLWLRRPIASFNKPLYSQLRNFATKRTTTAHTTSTDAAASSFASTATTKIPHREAVAGSPRYFSTTATSLVTSLTKTRKKLYFLFASTAAIATSLIYNPTTVTTDSVGMSATATTATTTTTGYLSLSSLRPSWLRWVPSSAEELMAAEKNMLSCVSVPYEQRMVRVGEHEINTLIAGSGPPLVLIHGFAAGIGFWTGNIDELSTRFTVYAIDLLGFGRSSRPAFVPSTPSSEDMSPEEQVWIESIHAWSEAMELKSFVLLGHSLGGFLSGSFALKHPEKVRHLILADPWGVPSKPEEDTNAKRLPLRWRMVVKLLQMGSPLGLLRASGPAGPALVARVRPDIPDKFSHLYERTDIVSNYIYHLNAQTPATGEAAFAALTIPIGWAKNPLEKRLHQLSDTVPTTLLYGSHTWMPRGAGRRLKNNLKGPAKFVTIEEAGHHIYIDNYQAFNNAVLLVADGLVEDESSVGPASTGISEAEALFKEQKPMTGEALEKATGM